MDDRQRIVVIGCSVAGLHAVETLRDEGFAGDISVISAERQLQYDRQPLSKELLSGMWTQQQTLLREQRQLDDLRINFRVGEKATSLDIERRTVSLNEKEVLSYDGLIIATGCEARVLPRTAPMAGVHTLRTMDDCIGLRRELLDGARLVVIGAGFIGAEVAASARQIGVDVTVVDPLATPMQNILGRQIGNRLADFHSDHGVTWKLGRAVREIAGGNRVSEVLLQDGEKLPADAVLLAVGARPTTSWLAGSGLNTDNGVRCDAFLHAGPPDIVAAGDVANWPHPDLGQRVRVEHWTNAVEQGAAAARNLLGAAAGTRNEYRGVPYFWSDQHDLHIKFLGVRGDEERSVLNDPAQPAYVTLFGRKGTLCGVLAVNSSRAFLRARRMLAKHVAVEHAAAELDGVLAKTS